jgi:large subunit ribosomal protein L29
MLKAQELRDQSEEALKDKLSILRQEIFNLRSEKLEGKEKKPHLIGQKRKEIARILTILNERQ